MTRTTRHRPKRKARLVLASILLIHAYACSSWAADAMVRVLSERAEVHTGPGFPYRVVHVASRGDVLPARGRATTGYWFQVTLPDGTFGWVLGDQVLPLEVDTSYRTEPPSIWQRMAGAVFSPSPLLDSRIGLTFSAGFLGGDGMFLFRPSIQLEPHIALEAFVGETLGDQVDVIYYGAGANVFLFPSSPVVPFFALGGGGASSRRKADQFTVKVGDFSTLNVGGGLLVAFKKRITLRFDARNHVIFDPNLTKSAREFSGGLAIYF